MAMHTFLQVRLPARTMALGVATTRKGEAEALVEPVVRKTQEAAFRVWALVKGLSASEMHDLSEAIREKYSVTPRVKETEQGHRVLYDAVPRHLQDNLWGILLAFQTSFAPPWLGFKGGHVTLRAQGVGCEPKECAARLQRALDLAGAGVRVEIVQVPDEGLAVLHGLNAWRESEVGEPLETPIRDLARSTPRPAKAAKQR